MGNLSGLTGTQLAKQLTDTSARIGAILQGKRSTGWRRRAEIWASNLNLVVEELDARLGKALWPLGSDEIGHADNYGDPLPSEQWPANDDERLAAVLDLPLGMVARSRSCMGRNDWRGLRRMDRDCLIVLLALSTQERDRLRDELQSERRDREQLAAWFEQHESQRFGAEADMREIAKRIREGV